MVEARQPLLCGTTYVPDTMGTGLLNEAPTIPANLPIIIIAGSCRSRTPTPKPKEKLPPNVVKPLAQVDQWLSFTRFGAYLASPAWPRGNGDELDQIEYRC